LWESEYGKAFEDAGVYFRGFDERNFKRSLYSGGDLGFAEIISKP
jgi:hypothetical protein